MSSDRKALIRLASTLEKGSEERRVLLAELQKAAQDLDNDYFNSVVDALPRRVGSWNVSNEYGAALFEGNTGWEFGGMPAFSFYARPESGFGGGEVVVDLQIGEDGYGGPGTFSVKWTGDAKKDAGVLLSSLQKNWGKIKGYWMKELSSGISNSLRLASTLPKGSEERRTLLSELQKTAGRFPATGVPSGVEILASRKLKSAAFNFLGRYDLKVDVKSNGLKKYLPSLQQAYKEVVAWNEANDLPRSDFSDLEVNLQHLTDILEGHFGPTINYKDFEMLVEYAEEVESMWP